MSAHSAQLSFGIKTSQSGLTYNEIRQLWREADRIDVFEHAWLWDHMLPLRGEVTADTLEAWTLLAALAVQTERLRLGVIVTSNRLRPPTLLAKMAATVDIVSSGRLVMGVGVGGSRVVDAQVLAGVHREFNAYGIDVVAPGVAVAALGEACTIFRRMWSDPEPFDYQGSCYVLKGAICQPKPVQRPGPPILIGAGGDRVLRVVAEHADIWNCPTRSAEEFRKKNAVLNQQCASIGRDPAEITRSVQVLVARDAKSDDASRRAYGAPAVRDLLVELITSGASHLVLAPVPPLPSAAWLADEVIRPVLAELGTADQRETTSQITVGP